MNLQLGGDEAAFLRRLREWLASVERPVGLRDFGLTPTREDLPAARAWQRLMDEAGFAGLSWPREVGGAGATDLEQAIFAEELALAGLPRVLNVTGELAAHALIDHGSDRQKTDLLGPTRVGDLVWCQLFSEPGAGSDLASVTTRVDRGQVPWRVTGRKIWTSSGHYADYGLLLAVTGPGEPTKRRLTMFALPMDRPGIAVYSLRQLDGHVKFNEVVIDDVAIGETDAVGPVGDGWRVAMGMLGRERLALGAQCVSLFNILTDLREASPDMDAATLRRWTALWSRVIALRTTWLRAVTASPSPGKDALMSILKLESTRLQQMVTAVAEAGLGARAIARPAAGRDWAQPMLASLGATIAGGTSEIQREIIGERVLGLPRQPRKSWSQDPADNG